MRQGHRPALDPAIREQGEELGYAHTNYNRRGFALVQAPENPERTRHGGLAFRPTEWDATWQLAQVVKARLP
jgi:hypothetical protein